MSNDLNQVTVIGRLTRDPESKFTNAGLQICNFSIAVNEKSKTGDYCNFFDVASFGKTAEICGKYLKKGSQVAVNGSLKQNRWTDNATNKTMSKVSVSCKNIYFLGGNDRQNNQSVPQQNVQNLQQNAGGQVQDPYQQPNY